MCFAMLLQIQSLVKHTLMIKSVLSLNGETYRTEMYMELMGIVLFKLCPSKQATIFHSQNKSYCCQHLQLFL